MRRWPRWPIQKTAWHGMSLKDASIFNIQFVDGRPVMIDTLSIEQLPLEPGRLTGSFAGIFWRPWR